MIFGFLLLVVLYFLWILLVKGALWKLMIGFFGWLGMHWALQVYIPESKHVCLIVTGYTFSWSQVIPTIIVLMAMAYTKE